MQAFSSISDLLTDNAVEYTCSVVVAMPLSMDSRVELKIQKSRSGQSCYTTELLSHSESTITCAFLGGPFPSQEFFSSHRISISIFIINTDCVSYNYSTAATSNQHGCEGSSPHSERWP